MLTQHLSPPVGCGTSWGTQPEALQQGGSPLSSLTTWGSVPRRAEALFPGSKSSQPRRGVEGPNQISPPGGGWESLTYVPGNSSVKIGLSLVFLIRLIIYFYQCEFMYVYVILWVIIQYYATLWLRSSQLWPSGAQSGWSPPCIIFLVFKPFLTFGHYTILRAHLVLCISHHLTKEPPFFY